MFSEVELTLYTHDQRIYYTTFVFGVSILAWRGHFASHGLCTKIREVEPLHALSHNQRYLNGTWCVSPVARVDTLSCQRVAKTKASETAMLGNHGMARTFCVCVEYKHTNTLVEVGKLNEVVCTKPIKSVLRFLFVFCFLEPVKGTWTKCGVASKVRLQRVWLQCRQ